MPVYFPRYRFACSYPEAVDRMFAFQGHPDRPVRPNPQPTTTWSDLDSWLDDAWPDDEPREDTLATMNAPIASHRCPSREVRYCNFLRVLGVLA